MSFFIFVEKNTISYGSLVNMSNTTSKRIDAFFRFRQRK